jgi:hypothetical protein
MGGEDGDNIDAGVATITDDEESTPASSPGSEEYAYSFEPPKCLGLRNEELASCLEVSWGKRLAIFDTGFIGIVSGQSQEGDTGVVLFGCSMPLIVRTQAAGPSLFIGECYVHGIAEGEAMLGDHPVGFATTTIKIG